MQGIKIKDTIECAWDEKGRTLYFSGKDELTEDEVIEAGFDTRICEERKRNITRGEEKIVIYNVVPQTCFQNTDGSMSCGMPTERNIFNKPGVPPPPPATPTRNIFAPPEGNVISNSYESSKNVPQPPATPTRNIFAPSGSSQPPKGKPPAPQPTNIFAKKEEIIKPIPPKTPSRGTLPPVSEAPKTLPKPIPSKTLPPADKGKGKGKAKGSYAGVPPPPTSGPAPPSIFSKPSDTKVVSFTEEIKRRGKKTAETTYEKSEAAKRLPNVIQVEIKSGLNINLWDYLPKESLVYINDSMADYIREHNKKGYMTIGEADVIKDLLSSQVRNIFQAEEVKVAENIADIRRKAKAELEQETKNALFVNERRVHGGYGPWPYREDEGRWNGFDTDVKHFDNIWSKVSYNPRTLKEHLAEEMNKIKEYTSSDTFDPNNIIKTTLREEVDNLSNTIYSSLKNISSSGKIAENLRNLITEYKSVVSDYNSIKEEYENIRDLIKVLEEERDNAKGGRDKLNIQANIDKLSGNDVYIKGVDLENKLSQIKSNELWLENEKARKDKLKELRDLSAKLREEHKEKIRLKIADNKSRIAELEGEADMHGEIEEITERIEYLEELLRKPEYDPQIQELKNKLNQISKAEILIDRSDILREDVEKAKERLEKLRTVAKVKTIITEDEWKLNVLLDQLTAETRLLKDVQKTFDAWKSKPSRNIIEGESIKNELKTIETRIENLFNAIYDRFDNIDQYDEVELGNWDSAILSYLSISYELSPKN